MRQGRDEVEESLAAVESLLALNADQLGGATRASIESPTCDLRQVLGRILDADDIQTGPGQHTLVLTRRQKKEISDRSADRDLLGAQRPCQHHRDDEKNPSPPGRKRRAPSVSTPHRSGRWLIASTQRTASNDPLSNGRSRLASAHTNVARSSSPASTAARLPVATA